MKSMETVTELDRQFGIPGIAQVVTGNGGLPKVRVTAPAAEGEIYLHGAHVTSWRRSGVEEALFVSTTSRWQDGIAIRGGVPICFPWFGDKADDPKAPAHGFVRTKPWRLDAIARSGDAVTVTMSTGSDEGTRQWWPAEFRLNYRATFGSELSLELELLNTGPTALRFEEALHAYHRVGDVRTARLEGLDGIHYLDKTANYHENVQSGDGYDCERNRPRLPRYPGRSRVTRPGIASAHPRQQREFADNGGLESMGGKSQDYVRFGRRRVDEHVVRRNQQCTRLRRRGSSFTATLHESGHPNWRFVIRLPRDSFVG